MNAAYNAMKQKTLGKSYDIDGHYGAQCWDFACYVMENYIKNGKRIHCGISGYVKDIANQKNINGILNFCHDIPTDGKLEPGDICIWTECPQCPYSHIAIFDHADSNGYHFLGQNQGASYVNIVRLSRYGLIGVFRPKEWNGMDSKKEVIWNYEAILEPGDIVSSRACSLENFSNGKYIKNNCVNVPDLGGAIPLDHITEASNTGDGKFDNILSSVKAKVWLDETPVEAVAEGDLVKIHGYWVHAGPLCRKEYR